MILKPALVASFARALLKLGFAHSRYSAPFGTKVYSGHVSRLLGSIDTAFTPHLISGTI